MRIILFLLSVCCVSLLHAQITIDPLPIPTSDDTVVRSVSFGNVDIDLGASGIDQSWDWILNDSNTINTVITAHDSDSLFGNANFKFSTIGALDQYYWIDGTSWDLLGSTGTDPVGFGISVRSRYNVPFSQLMAPMAYEDMSSVNARLVTDIPIDNLPDSILNLLPLVPDSLRVIVSIDRDEEVDASGMLLINDKSWEVLRQKRTDMRVVTIEAKISILPWTDITSTVLALIPLEFPTRDTVMSYRFHAQGEGLPVAEVFVGQNDTIDRVEYTRQPITAGTRHVALPDLAVFPNPSRGEFTVTFDEGVGAQVLVHIYNPMGRRLHVQTIDVLDRQANVRLDVGTGIYLLRMTNQRGNVIAKDQLIQVQ